MLHGLDYYDGADDLRAEDFFNVDEVISPDYLKEGKEEQQDFPEPIFLIESPDDVPRSDSSVSEESADANAAFTGKSNKLSVSEQYEQCLQAAKQEQQ